MPSSVPPAVARKVIRWGIIGCGDVTEVKSGPGFQRASGSQLVAVMRRNGALAADYAKRHGVARWYDDATALVQDPEVDAIYVATPPNAHLDGAKLAAAARKPCYVEKPMARHTPECDLMLSAFADAGVPLFIAYYRRALPRFLKVRDILEAGALGQLTGFSYRFASAAHQAQPAPVATGSPPVAWRVQAAIAGGGLFLDVGSHALDLCDFFLGPLQKVRGQAARLASPGDVEDAVAMSFSNAAGVPGVAQWNFASHVKLDVMEFAGTRGHLSFSVFGNEPLRLESARGVETLDLPNPPHIQQPMIQTVVDQLLGRGTCASTGDSGRRTTVVMDDVLESYYGRRDDAFWDRVDTWPGRVHA